MLHYCNDHLNVPTKEDETGDNAAGGEANGTGAAAEGESAESGAPPAAGADESSPTVSGATDEAQPNGTAEDAKSDEPTPDTHQAFAVLGLALIAMGEDVGAQMSLRSLNHLVRLPLTCL
jgi:26S proteasome regulatory subunit N1